MITFLMVVFFLAFCAMTAYCTHLLREKDRLESSLAWADEQAVLVGTQWVEAYQRLQAQRDEAEANYVASEQGLIELEESYQMEALDAHDKATAIISEREERIKELEEELLFSEQELEMHDMHCLPHLTDIRLESLIRKELEAAIPE